MDHQQAANALQHHHQHLQQQVQPGGPFPASAFSFALEQPQQQQQQQNSFYPHPQTLPYPSFPPLPPLGSGPSVGSVSGTTPSQAAASISPPQQRKRSRSADGGEGGGKGAKRKKGEREAKGEERGGESESPMGREKVKLTRGSRACTVCRKLKMKCEGAETGPPCKRCAQNQHECIFEESMRGKRNSKKHEALSRSIHKIEQTLAVLQAQQGLHHASSSPGAGGSSTTSPLPAPQQPPTASSPESPLPNLPDNTLNPLGLLAEASLSKHRPRRPSSRPRPANADHLEEYKDIFQAQEQGVGKGIAGESYFRPGPMTLLPIRRMVIERAIQPEILTFLEMEEVLALFQIFFDHLNDHCCLLDRAFHTPSLVCSRSPFLLTAICAIASKFYSGPKNADGELHVRLTNVAKKLAWSVPAQGYKSVEIVQAYLLLALWGSGPVQRFELDRTWLLLGMAIRMATDLNLHRASTPAVPPPAEVEEEEEEETKRATQVKETRNRERTWVLCYNLDRSLSAQMGKPYSIKEDYIIRNAYAWAKSPDALPADIALCGFLEYQRILSRCVEFLYSGTSDPSGLVKDCDLIMVIRAYETQLIAWRDAFHKERGWHDQKEMSMDPAWQYRVQVSALHHHYSMLVINSFGLHHARERSHVDIAHFFVRCYTSAVECTKIIVQQLGPSGYLKYSPDSHFVQCSYAVITLLKLIREEFRGFLPENEDPIAYVREAADTLANVAVNPHHTPALYAAFLRALITVKADHSGVQTRTGSPSRSPPLPPNTNTHAQLGGADVHEPQAYLENGHSHPPAGGDADHVPEPVYGVQQLQQVYGEPAPGMPGFGMFPHDGAQGQYPVPSGEAGVEGGYGGMDPGGMFGGILTDAFWEGVLLPGYSSTMEGLSGGFLYGSGGSGLITPQLGSPRIGSPYTGMGRGS